ncbi:hypothetical protein AYX14_07154 [Cryptococcus neoformans]|nr:hypothetical protein AYX14_07154 [Cryptococcus neoformans var. grubii]
MISYFFYFVQAHDRGADWQIVQDIGNVDSKDISEVPGNGCRKQIMVGADRDIMLVSIKPNTQSKRVARRKD